MSSISSSSISSLSNVSSVHNDSGGEDQSRSRLVRFPAVMTVRPRPFIYTIHTYVAGHNDVVDQSFAFRLDRRVNRQFTDQLFRGVNPLAPCLMDSRSRVEVHSKVMVLKGLHKNKGGVVVGRQRGAYRIVVEDSSILVVRRVGFKLLDYGRYLPFGVPVGKWICDGR